MPPVEQIKAKRAGIGLRACDRGRAFPGFTLFAPQSGGGKVYLIDLDGNAVHAWQMPYAPGNSGYLTERGTYFYNGKTVENSARYISRQPWKGGAALEAECLERGGGQSLCGRGSAAREVVASSCSAHSRARGNPGHQAPEFATLDPRFRGDERRRGMVRFHRNMLSRV